VAALAVASWILSAPAAGAQTPPGVCLEVGPCLLTAGLPDGEELGHRLTPDGTRVVFSYRAAGTTLVHLYSVSVRGGAPSRLTTDTGFLVDISPDSSRVLYSANPEPGESGEPGPTVLYSVPVSGPASARVRLAGDIARGSGSRPLVQISPDSRKVVYVPNAGQDRLVVVPIAGPANAGGRLTDPFAAGRQVGRFEISADSRSVVYRDQHAGLPDELFRVPLTLAPDPDPPTTRLNGPVVAGGDVIEFQLAPNGKVLYRADQERDGQYELYRVNLGGAERVKLSRLLPADRTVGGGLGGPIALVTGDGSRVVYRTHHQWLDAGFDELYSVPMAGPAPAGVLLVREPTDHSADRVQEQLGGGYLVYITVDATGQSLLHSVPLTGPASAAKVLSFPSRQTELPLTPDGERVLWMIGSSLFILPTGGGQHTRLNGDEQPIHPLLVNTTGSRIVYRSGESNGRNHLYSASAGGGERFNLTTLLASVDIDRVALTDDGLRAVYTVSRPGQPSRSQLYSSRLVPSILPPTSAAAATHPYRRNLSFAN
jgi:Tol biopolymer transport system component